MNPLKRGFFSVVNIIVVHNLWLVESVDVEPWMWKDCDRGLTSSLMEEIFTY